MNDNRKTKEQLIQKLEELRLKNAELEKSEAERKLSEERLSQSEEKYRNLFHNAEVGIFRSRLDGSEVLEGNHRFLDIVGMALEETVGKPSVNLWADPKEREEMVKRLIVDGSVSAFECKMLNKRQGKVRNCLTSLRLYQKQGVLEGSILDITERKQAAEALKVSEEKYRTIIETIADGYYEVDLAGNLIFFNDELAKIYGYPREALMGINNRVYTDEENARKMYQAFNRVYRTGEPDRGVRFEIITSEKNRKTMEFSITLIRDATGNAVGFRGIARDVTDLMQAQTALKESEERYRTIIETIEDGYFEVDLRGNLTYFNDTMVRIHEYPRVELLGMNNRQFTDAENAKILFEAFNKVYRTAEPSKGTHYEIITKGGGRKNLESSVSLIRDPNGNPVGFRGIVRDVTEIRQAQEALQSSEERFRVAAESSNDFIYEWNLESGQVDWFGKAVERLGEMLGELPDTHLAFVKKIYPEDLERITKAVRRHLKQGEPHLEEYRLVGKEGNIIHVKSAGLCLRNEAGSGYKWIGALSDITERKRAEEELKDSLNKLHKAIGGIIKAMTLTVESRDPYTAGHQQRVSNLARTIAQEMGLSKDQVEAIRMAGVVHDVGKISVPAEILSKPTKLSDTEFAIIKGHPQTSYDILKDIEFPWPIAEIALQHHERMDGSGYPSGLKGDQILLEAQILMVADVVEANASHRPYRPAKGIDMALEEISKNKGKLFNPAAVEACLRLFREKGYKI